MAYTIGACGFIGTGSSVVSDFLKEFEETQTLDQFEFKIAYQTDGLFDLRFHLTNGNMKSESTIVALNRFRRSCAGYAYREYRNATRNQFDGFIDQFLDEIIQGGWVSSLADPVDEPFRNWMIRLLRKIKFFKLYSNIEKKKNREIEIYPLRKGYFSNNPETFNDAAKELIGSILEAMGKESGKHIVLDQPFPGNNPAAVFDFFEKPKAVVVERDPRDMYVLYSSIGYPRAQRQYPTWDVNTFIKYYRGMREGQPYRDINKDVLVVRYEDMIYKYEETSKVVSEFCDVHNHVTPRKYFDPSLSINNTQAFKRYKGFEKDIEIIEQELDDYLYDYSEFDSASIEFGDAFGDNPLNAAGKKWKKQ